MEKEKKENSAKRRMARQKVTAGAVVAALLVILVLFLLWQNAAAESTASVDKVAAEVADELTGYLDEYFTDASTYVTEEDVQLISEEITSGILASVGGMTEEEEEALRASILASVRDELSALNGSLSDVEDLAEGTSAVTQDLLDYIDNTIVPALSVQIQLSRTLSESALSSVKSQLLTTIEENKELSETQKTELSEEIEALSASTAAELADEVEALNEKIKAAAVENEAALSEAVAALYGGADNTVTIEDLLSQIEANSLLTKAQKEELSEMIESLSLSTDATIAEVKEELAAEVENRTEAVELFASTLKESMDESIGQLQQTVTEQIKELEASMDEALSGISFYTEDGHIYAEWTDGEGNEIVKKLDFAQ